MEWHSLLKRQLSRYFRESSPLQEEWQEFIASINAAYQSFDDDRALLERTLDLISQELIQLNSNIASRLAFFPEENPNPVLELKTAGAITYVNPAAKEKFPDLAKLGMNHPVLNDVLSLARRLQDMQEKFTVREIKVDSSVYEQQITSSSGNDLIRIYMSDITGRRRAEEMIEHQAYHDALTKLPNRALCTDRLNQAIARLEWHHRLVAVLFLDLDHFKRINDTLGHTVGDNLLRVVAKRLSNVIRDGDTVSRLGGDEFAIILADIAQPEDVIRIVQKILFIFSMPLQLDKNELFITASIGICISPNDGKDAETLLRNADTAMYRAKDEGRNNYQFYLPEMNTAVAERLAMETDIRRALEREEFLLHYQPFVDLITGEILGVEALIRWQHPDRGLISPATFIPLAEETGLIVPIGEWVLLNACTQLKTWHLAGFPWIRVAVNISARQFQQHNLLAMIEKILEKTGVDPHCLELELTESILQATELTVTTIRELSARGIEISVDDFGTGYSSLSYLKRFSINKLKVDQSFIRDLDTDPDNRAIVTAIISLAHSLRLRVIAEGVETVEQLQFLRSQNCNELQGYLFSRPLPVQEITQILAEKRRLQ